MARSAHGYTLRWRGPERGWYVRFRVHGKRHDLPTGVKGRREKAAAEIAAREIYARAVRGERAPDPRRSNEDFVKAADRWLNSVAVRDVTRVTYEKYAGYWVSRWSVLGELTDGAIAIYIRSRLREARGKTVANECSALRNFLRWCVDTGLLLEAPPVPKVDKAAGVGYRERRRVAAPELAPEEIWALIEMLPEKSGRAGWPVRARAIVAYTTTLRPGTLDKLRVPDHYSKGATVLRITHDIDKEGFAREVPLPQIARDALDSVCPDVGLIFGRHRLGPYLQAAAADALPPHKAAVFTAQHFRSAGITYTLERSGNLPGVQAIAGHRHASTTSKYVRAGFRAAQQVMSIWEPKREPADE